MSIDARVTDAKGTDAATGTAGDLTVRIAAAAATDVATTAGAAEIDGKTRSPTKAEIEPRE